MTTKRASNSEEEYFARQEGEHGRERDRQIEQAAHDRLRELHFLRCPKCGMELEAVTLQDTQIDRCNSCRGIWLDQGELEHLAGRGPGILQKIVGMFRNHSGEARLARDDVTTRR